MGTQTSCISVNVETDMSGIKCKMLAHHRPIDQQYGMLIAAKREIILTSGDKDTVLFSRTTREWLRLQLELGRKVELVPDL